MPRPGVCGWGCIHYSEGGQGPGGGAISDADKGSKEQKRTGTSKTCLARDKPDEIKIILRMEAQHPARARSLLHDPHHLPCSPGMGPT